MAKELPRATCYRQISPQLKSKGAGANFLFTKQEWDTSAQRAESPARAKKKKDSPPQCIVGTTEISRTGPAGGPLLMKKTQKGGVHKGGKVYFGANTCGWAREKWEWHSTRAK